MKRSLVLLGVLAGCGGGGGSVSPPVAPPPPSVAAATAWASIIRTPRTIAVSGVGSDGVARSMSYTVGAATVGVESGMPATQVPLSAVLRRGDVTESVESSTLYIRDSGAIFAVVRQNGDCGIADSPGVIPATASLQQSGPLYSVDIVGGCTTAGWSFEREQASWSIESEASTAYLCILVKRSGLATGLGSTQQVCMETSAAGVVGPAARITLTSGTTFSLVMR